MNTPAENERAQGRSEKVVTPPAPPAVTPQKAKEPLPTDSPEKVADELGDVA